MLQQAGYETAWIGKIHMGNDPTPRPGFDYWVSFPGQGAYVNPKLHIDGELRQVEGYITDLLSDLAVKFIRRPHDKPFALCISHKAVHGPFTPAERHADLYRDDPLPHPPNLSDSLDGKPQFRATLPRNR